MATKIRPTAGKVLADAMKAAGLSQVALSKASGINPRYLSSMINGDRPITPETSVSLSIPLQIPPERLAVAWTEQRVRQILSKAQKLAAALASESTS